MPPSRPLPRLTAWATGCLLVATLAAGCARPNAAAAESSTATTLYDRLGGAPTVVTVVDRTVDRAATDPRTLRSFDGVKLKALKESLALQICSISGGGCRYEGDTMAVAHHDSHIVASEFDAMVTILREELDRAGVDPGAKNALLRLLAPMKRDIVAAG